MIDDLKDVDDVNDIDDGAFMMLMIVDELNDKLTILF